MKATRVRRDAGIRPESPVCIYDLAKDMGVDVRFLDLPSLEGMYSKEPEPVMVISSLRPPGRQVYTAGHEMGHHVFGHGLRIDEFLSDDETDRADDEYLADLFAAFVLMPKKAILRGFERRCWNVASPTPLQIFTVAGWLGVGYESLINHMSMTLRLFGYDHSKSLKKTPPKKIKSELLGVACPDNLLVVDRHWVERAIDIDVGDYVVSPRDAVSQKPCLESCESAGQLAVFRASCPGIGRLYDPHTGWSSFVRVSRRGYVGRYEFRHFEEAEDAHVAVGCH